MKGDAVAPQLAGEIQPSFAFPLGNEFRYLEQWNQFSISSVVAEVGGVTATRVRLRNPAGSNVVGVVYFILVASNAAATDVLFVSLGPIAGDLPTLLTGQRLDARSQVGKGNLIPSSDTAGGPDSPQIGRTLLQPSVPQQIIFDDAQEITVLPGDSLGLSPNAVTAGNQFNFWLMWRERFLEESERT